MTDLESLLIRFIRGHHCLSDRAVLSIWIENTDLLSDGLLEDDFTEDEKNTIRGIVSGVV